MKIQSMILCVFAFTVLSMAPARGVIAADEEAAEVQSMRAEYDEISVIKMQRYDELMNEIAGIRERLEGLLAKEAKLSGEKVKAEVRFAESVKAAEHAGENVKKVLGDASNEDEKMRSFAEAVAKESTARREKIEKLKGALKEDNDEIKELQSSKNKAEAENAARNKEYRDVSSQELALEGKSPANKKNEAGEEDEAAPLKKLKRELEMKVQEGERSTQQLSQEILALAEKIRAAEEEVSALEREDSAQAKDLREKIENFDKAKKEDKQMEKELEGAKKIAEEASAKMLSEKAALKKLEEDLAQVSGEKLQAEKDLVEKTGELKVRVSVLVSQNERDQELLLKDTEPSEKKLKSKLKHAERDVIALRRKTERALLVNKEYKLKYNKEILEKHFNLAIVYEMNGLYKDAEKEYLACLKIDPKDADVHYNLAILYDDRLNNNKKAQKHYYKFLAYRPIGESGERVRDWIMRSELEKRLGTTVR